MITASCSMTVLVVASPCALVLSVPSAILVAIAAGARRGILFRGGVAVENIAGATQFAFDKTGTLTKVALSSSVYYIGVALLRHECANRNPRSLCYHHWPEISHVKYLSYIATPACAELPR